MSYTKGPWTCGHGLPGVFIPHQIDEDGNVDFDIIAPTVSTPENARLIAAAPELLEALKAFKMDWKELAGRMRGTTLDAIDKAIAKAEGRTE